MLKKTSISLCILVLLLLSFGIFEQNEYREWNYSKVEVDFESISVTASMIGTFKNVDGKERSFIRKSPYYLKIAISDRGRSLDTAKILSVEITRKDSGQPVVLSDSIAGTRFTPSLATDELYAAFVVDNIILLKGDYNVFITLEVCKAQVCERKIVTGKFQQEVIIYQRNALIDKFLSV